MPPLDPDIALILLAAGRSRRFGSDKLRADFRGAPLWEGAARASEQAGFSTLFMVVGEHSSLPVRAGWQVIVNANAEQGMGSSIAAGVAGAEVCSRIVIALADMPLVEASHLRRLAMCHGTVFTRYPDGTEGCPAGFPKEVFAELTSLSGDAGARSLNLADASSVEPPSFAMLADIDTDQDLTSHG